MSRGRKDSWDGRGNGYREETMFAFPVDIGTNDVGPSAQIPAGPIEVRFDTSEAGKIPRAYGVFGGREYPAVMTSYRYVIDGEVFESSNQYVDAPMVAAATIVARPDTRIELGTGADRVLVGWGAAELAPAQSITVQGGPGETPVLRFRGEWGADSRVEWKLFIDIGGG